MIFTGCFAVFSLLLSFASGLILPMKKTTGEADMDSVISHVTLMEQTISTLQTKVETSNTDLITVKSKLETAEQTIVNLQTQVQTNTIELTTVKAKLQSTEEELKVSKTDSTSVKDELKLAETNIAILNHDLQKLSDPLKLNQLKTEFEALKVSHNALVQQINITVIDAVSADVKTNTKEIQSLKSDLIKTETDVNKTSLDLLITNSEVLKFTSEMSIMNDKLNQSIQDVVSNKATISTLKSQLNAVNKSTNTTANKLSSLETHLTAVEAEYRSFQSIQNITEHEVAEYKALAQLTAADLKTVQTVQTAVHTELAAIRNQTNKDVAFQVTQGGGTHADWTTLTFDTVDFNTGNGYNKATGVFTAPTSGTYIFWANVLFCYPTVVHYISIYKGSHELAIGGCYVKTSGHDCGVYPTVTTHLDVGDQIHFTTHSSSYIRTGFSSFGGALVHVS